MQTSSHDGTIKVGPYRAQAVCGLFQIHVLDTIKDLATQIDLHFTQAISKSKLKLTEYQRQESMLDSLVKTQNESISRLESDM